jgi:hypothetical protein
MVYGPDRLIAELVELGHDAERVTADGQTFAVIPRYEVPLGRFAGRVIDLGIAAPLDFPRSVGASIHVRSSPQLLEKTDTVPNVRNITDSVLGPEWRYWSHNFAWPGETERSAARLMAKINGVFERA